MYIVTATRSTARMRAVRAGARNRRNPMIVLSNGSTIKIAPGRSVTLTEDTFQSNQNILREFSDCLIINKIGDKDPVEWREEADTEAPPSVPPEPIEDEEEAIIAPPTINEVIPDEVIEPPVEEPKPKATRRRRSKKSEEEVTTEVEEKPKRRRRSKKADS